MTFETFVMWLKVFGYSIVAMHQSSAGGAGLLYCAVRSEIGGRCFVASNTDPSEVFNELIRQIDGEVGGPP